MTLDEWTDVVNEQRRELAEARAEVASLKQRRDDWTFDEMKADRDQLANALAMVMLQRDRCHTLLGRIAFGSGQPGDRPLAGGVTVDARKLLKRHGIIRDGYEVEVEDEAEAATLEAWRVTTSERTVTMNEQTLRELVERARTVAIWQEQLATDYRKVVAQTVPARGAISLEHAANKLDQAAALAREAGQVAASLAAMLEQEQREQGQGRVAG